MQTRTAAVCAMRREYEHVGRLYKKRGGLGRHAKSPWVSRTFALANDGSLEYFDTDVLKTPRGALNLPRAEAFLSVVEDANDEAPTKHMMIITHIHGQRWKLCAESADDLLLWREKLSKFCRSGFGRVQHLRQPVQQPSPSSGSQIDGADDGQKTPIPVPADQGRSSVPIMANGSGGSTAIKDSKPVLRPPTATALLRPPGIRPERRNSQFKVTKDTANRTVPVGDILRALVVVNFGALVAWLAAWWPASIVVATLLNAYIAALVARSFEQAPPNTETLVSLIVPPARLPLLLRDANALGSRSLSDVTIGEDEQVMKTSSIVVPNSFMGAKPANKGSRSLMIAGATGLREVAFHENGGTPGTWSVAPASTFKIRQPGYAKNKRKAPSDAAFFQVVSVDLFDTEMRVNQISDHVLFPKPAVESPDPHIPSLFVVNAQIPSETGPLRVKLDADGHGYQVLICMQMTQQTRDELIALNSGRAAEVPRPRANALKLLKMYCRAAPDEPQLAPKERGRFKVIFTSQDRPVQNQSFVQVLAQVRNIDEVSIPSFAKGEKAASLHLVWVCLCAYSTAEVEIA